MKGFTSTTLDKDVALEFAIGELSDDVENFDKHPLLIEINITGNQQFFYLNNDEYSAFSYEKEVLLQDGIMYRVIDCQDSVETINR